MLAQDILESGAKILIYTEDLTFDQFVNDDKTVDAVIRNFEIIGEAANRLPEEFRDQHPEIDWHKIRGFRNRIVHDYFGIDYSIVWEIKTHFLPELLTQLGKLNL
ncbi:HepT-like ribonuclease domain-containing protein [Dyadobacter beijingensis]|uniref:HepT-like ribonuclease domain-containing protein n=1 Tax=Dyadobacter beijingensis TaxID=365489 RepID=UPI001B7FB232